MMDLPPGITVFERGWLSSNNILLEDNNQTVLIDSGYCTHSAQTLALVHSRLGDRALDVLLNTHLHSDHCGGNAALQATYPFLKTYIPPGNASSVRNWDTQSLTYEPTGQSCPPFSYSKLLEIGSTFEAATLSWDILAAPGHDPHSVIIFNARHGILVSADALWENGFGVVFPEIEGDSAFDEVQHTLDLIKSLDVKVVLPGHGQPFSDPTNALVRAQSRLNFFRDNPIKHALYAAKVLLKFKLLEWHQTSFNQLFAWSQQTPYFQLLHAKYWGAQSSEQWIRMLITELENAGAALVKENLISDLT
jgi:glyoxylase-like metal-dependent hydrolase (beta-lactamase superfamily II)